MYKQVKLLLIVLTSLSLALVAAGCAPSPKSQAVTVTTAVASIQELENRLEFSGVLVPVQTVDIASKLSGQVSTLGFKVGNPVKAGDILLQLDTEALNGQLLAAQASLQGAQAAAQSAQNQAAISEINLTAAQKYFDRTKQLFDAGALSQNQLEDAQDKLNIASQQFAAASGPAQAQAEASVSSAYANLKSLSVQIGNATIKSPIDGILTTQNVNLGQVISANLNVISIVDTSILKLKTTIGQDKLSLVSIGQAMNISIDSYPDRVFPGTITSIGPIAVSTGEVFPLEISMDNEAGLLAGLSAHCSLISKTQGITVPLASILQDNGASYVYVIADKKASRRMVKIGPQNDSEAQILSGLGEGEQVAMTNLNLLTDGMTVNTQ